MRPTTAIAALLALLTPTALPAQGPTTPAPPPAVYWPQDVFEIPYQWSGGSDQAAAEEVILYLSKDRGANWAEVTRAKPDVRSFVYRAEQDGELWFAVRTLDQTGRLWPAGGFSPELRVVVDTQIPRIVSLTGVLDPAGRMRIDVEAGDANLDPSSLRLAAQAGDSNEWSAVPLTNQPPAAGESAAGGLRAIAVWQAPAGVHEVRLRVSAEDFAGNPAGGGTVVYASADALAAPTESPPTRANPTGPVPARPVSTRPAAAGDPAGSDDPFLAAAPIAFPDAGRWAPAAAAPNPTPGATPWPADATASRPFRASDRSAWQSASPRRPRAIAQQATGGSPFRTAGASPRPAPNPPSAAIRPAPAASGAASRLIVNDPDFALEYDLQSTGDWGVSKVEIWGTSDGGQSWRIFAIDSDNRSPVNLNVDGPGRYGLRIVVEGVGSLPAERPRPGDPPEIEVVVDTQSPAARLTAVAQGTGYFGNHLIINWQAEDTNLAERPIALLYSNRPSGPWAPIATHLANESAGAGGVGRYAWRLRRGLPPRLYVRLEARDQAGNVATAQTPQPVTLRFMQPAAQIRGARTAE